MVDTISFDRLLMCIDPRGALKKTEKKIKKLEDVYLLYLIFWLKLFIYYIGFKI